MKVINKIGSYFVYFVTAARAVAETDIALYIGLSVALIVFIVLGFVVIRLMRRKGRDHVMYDMAPSGKSHIHIHLLIKPIQTKMDFAQD
jgi:hypothetical protein